MARIYLGKRLDGTEIGLFERNHPDLPYAVTVNGKIILYADHIADAYREYNAQF